MAENILPNLRDILAERFEDPPSCEGPVLGNDVLRSLAVRGSCRAFRDKPIPENWLDVLCAVALASPTKSDLQQRDIILLRDPDARKSLGELVAGQAWVAQAPMIAVFCGNNRRQRQLHGWQDVPFANDHLDAFFNAAGDAAIALGAFVVAAEAMGLGCCPISAVRNKSAEVSTLLGLPQYVFPFAGLAIGFPAAVAPVSKRLPLKVTCHTDRYQEDNLQEDIYRYSALRAASQPYGTQRLTAHFGEIESYGWVEDKVRQYSQPEREGFGAYVRAQGFNLD